MNNADYPDFARIYAEDFCETCVESAKSALNSGSREVLVSPWVLYVLSGQNELTRLSLGDRTTVVD